MKRAWGQVKAHHIHSELWVLLIYGLSSRIILQKLIKSGGRSKLWLSAATLKKRACLGRGTQKGTRSTAKCDHLWPLCCSQDQRLTQTADRRSKLDCGSVLYKRACSRFLKNWTRPLKWATCHKSSQFCRIVHESDGTHANFVLHEGVSFTPHGSKAGTFYHWLKF